MTNITDFFNQHYAYIWDTTALHRKESVAKMQVFFDFAGNADKRLDEISGADISTFCRYLKETRSISDNTINHYRSALSRFFNYAQDYLDLPKIPNIKFVKVKNQRVRFLAALKSNKSENIWLATNTHGCFQCLTSASIPPECASVRYCVCAPRCGVDK